jgi:chromosome partitioning protein
MVVPMKATSEVAGTTSGGGAPPVEVESDGSDPTDSGGSSGSDSDDHVDDGMAAATLTDGATPSSVIAPGGEVTEVVIEEPVVDSAEAAGGDASTSASSDQASPVDPTPPADPTPTIDPPDEEVPAVAPTGRQPQAASGNPLPRVLAVANQKGGVGKTTTSVNLGAALAELGFRVLVIDLDPQGNATTGLGIDARNFELSMYDVLMRDSSLEDCVEPTSMKNLFVAPATIALAGAEIELVPAFSRELKLKRAIETVIDDFDYVLIDCPPSLGLITVNALAAADEVLVPIQCEYYALEGLSQLMRNVHLVASNLNPRLDISTIVLTMYDARTKLADQVATEVRDHFGNKVCRIVIPRTVRLSEAPSFGQPITAFDPASRGAIAYRELAKEVSGGTS